MRSRQCEAISQRRGGRCPKRALPGIAVCSVHHIHGHVKPSDEIDPRIAERMRAVLEGA